MNSFLKYTFCLVALVGLGCQPVAALANALTLYKGGEALVKEQRPVSLNAGEQSIKLADFPLQIDPDSLLVQPVNGPAWALRQQTFKYDRLDRLTLLHALVGKPVRFVDSTITGPDDPPYVGEGILRTAPVTAAPPSLNEREPGRLQQARLVLVETADGLRPVSPNSIVLENYPEGLTLEPEIELKVEAQKAGKGELGLVYFTDGLPWDLHYNAIVQADKTLDLQGHLTLENQTGKDWSSVSLSMVPANLNKPKTQRKSYGGMRAMAAMELADAMPAPAPTHLEAKRLGDYPLYRFPVTVDLIANERKQIAWLNAETIPYEKRYVFDPNPGSIWLGYSYSKTSGEGEAHPNQEVESRLRFSNKGYSKEQRSLGQALPGGSITVYQADAEGNLQWIGSDTLNATPTGEPIELTLGRAFDLLAEKKQVGYRKLKKGYEADYEVTLTNRSDKPVTIDVLDHPYGEWELLGSNYQPEESRGRRLRFSVAVPSKAESVLTYSIKKK